MVRIRLGDLIEKDNLKIAGHIDRDLPQWFGIDDLSFEFPVLIDAAMITHIGKPELMPEMTIDLRESVEKAMTERTIGQLTIRNWGTDDEPYYQIEAFTIEYGGQQPKTTKVYQEGEMPEDFVSASESPTGKATWKIPSSKQPTKKESVESEPEQVEEAGDLRVEVSNALIYSRGVISWEEYLKQYPFVDNRGDGIRPINETIPSSLESLRWKTHELIVSPERAEQMIQEESKRPTSGFSALGANFDWGMGGVLWKLEIQKPELTEILQPLQASLNEQEKAVRIRADEAYQQGWYDDAFKDYELSVEKNYQDFAAHLSIGNIYLYHQINFDKSLESFLKASKYAETQSSYYASYAYLYAAFVCYLQGKDEDACEYAQKSVQLMPDIPEVHYSYAKFSASGSNTQAVIDHLETAILADANYCFKVNGDKDFDAVRESIDRLFESFCQKAKQEATEAVKLIDTLLGNYVFLTEEARQEKGKIEEILQDAKQLAQNQVYLDYLSIPSCFERAQRVLDLSSSYAKIKEIKGHSNMINSLAFSGDESYLASASSDGNIKIYEVDSFREVTTLTEHSLGVQSVAFSPTGRYLASGNSNGTLKIYEVWDRFREVKIFYLTGSLMTVWSVAFSPDGRYLAGSSRKTIEIYEVGSFREVKTLTEHSDTVHSIAFSPDGCYLASASSDGYTKIYEVGSFSEVTTFREDSDFHSLAFSPDGCYLASASVNKINIYEVDSFSEVTTLEGGGSVAFSPNGRYMVSGKIYEVDSFREVMTIDDTCFAFSPDGRYLASGWHTTITIYEKTGIIPRQVFEGKVKVSSQEAIDKAKAELRKVEPESEHRFAKEKFGLAQDKLQQAQKLFEQDIAESYQEAEYMAKEVQKLGQEVTQAKKSQQDIWEGQKKCRECGEPIVGFLDKLLGKKTCKKHR